MMYQVRYTFEAVEESELGVQEGDIVRVEAPEGFDPASSWTKVSSTKPPFLIGFVPTKYLEKISESFSVSSAATNVPPGPSVMKQQSQPFVGVGVGVGGGLASQQQSKQLPSSSSSTLLDESSIILEGGPSIIARSSPMKFPMSSLSKSIQQQPAMSTMAMTNPITGSGGEEFAGAFARHDRMFQQVMSERQSHSDALLTAINDISTRLMEVKKKSAGVSESLMDINQVIEGERKRWKEKLQTDKAAMYNNIAQNNKTQQLSLIDN